jgi:hypothetical protein
VARASVTCNVHCAGWAYSDMPSFSSQLAISLIAASLTTTLAEQKFGLFQIKRVKAFSEPAVDRSRKLEAPHPNRLTSAAVTSQLVTPSIALVKQLPRLSVESSLAHLLDRLVVRRASVESDSGQ